MSSGSDTLQINVGPDGMLGFIYDDDLNALLGLGSAELRRASHVEPIDGKWYADLSPVRGPMLGPFALRAEALRAEVDWLHAHGY